MIVENGSLEGEGVWFVNVVKKVMMWGVCKGVLLEMFLYIYLFGWIWDINDIKLLSIIWRCF